MNFRILPLVLIAFAGAAIHSLQAQSRSITVDATGSVDVKPDQLAFTVSLTKYADTIAKAKEQFDAQKKDFLSTFNVMKFKGLSLKSTSKTISTQPFGGGGMGGGMAPPIAFGGGGVAVPAAEVTSQFYVSESIQLTVDGIDRLTDKEVDTEIMRYVTELKKLGLTPTSGFTTSIKDKQQATNLAFAQAMKQAKSKAKVLAELSEGKVGRVLKVDQNSFPGGIYNGYGGMGMPFAVNAAGVVGYGISKSQKVSANLRVTFELSD